MRETVLLPFVGGDSFSLSRSSTDLGSVYFARSERKNTDAVSDATPNT